MPELGMVADNERMCDIGLPQQHCILHDAGWAKTQALRDCCQVTRVEGRHAGFQGWEGWAGRSQEGARGSDGFEGGQGENHWAVVGRERGA